ncbi:MAG: M24 family metallopeptidase [Bacillaceae bacterium]
MSKRITELQNWLKEKNINGAFITSTPNVFYLSNFHCEPHERLLGVFLFQEKEPFLVCPQMDAARAKEAGWGYDIVSFTDTDNSWELVKQAVEKRGVTINTLAIEKEHVNVQRYEALKALFQATFVSAEEKLHTLRMLKDEKEIAILRQAAKLADDAIEIGISCIKEGVSELDILGQIEYELKKKGVQHMSFDTMVLTGKNSALPHGVPGTTKVQKGDFVLFDLGVVVDGYCSDITRTVAFDHVSEEQERIYQTVLKGQLEAVKHSVPGTQLGQLDKYARDIIAAAGYGDYFTHRLGHGLGIDIHEFPSLNETNTMTLQKGMVYTIEPGIYVPNVGGVRIEDDIVITETGHELLTQFTKELVIVK